MLTNNTSTQFNSNRRTDISNESFPEKHTSIDTTTKFFSSSTDTTSKYFSATNIKDKDNPNKKESEQVNKIPRKRVPYTTKNGSEGAKLFVQLKEKIKNINIQISGDGIPNITIPFFSVINSDKDVSSRDFQSKIDNDQIINCIKEMHKLGYEPKHISKMLGGAESNIGEAITILSSPETMSMLKGLTKSKGNKSGIYEPSVLSNMLSGAGVDIGKRIAKLANSTSQKEFNKLIDGKNATQPMSKIPVEKESKEGNLKRKSETNFEFYNKHTKIHEFRIRKIILEINRELNEFNIPIKIDETFFYTINKNSNEYTETFLSQIKSDQIVEYIKIMYKLGFPKEHIFGILFSAAPNINEILRVLTDASNIAVLIELINSKWGKPGIFTHEHMFDILSKSGSNIGAVIFALAHAINGLHELIHGKDDNLSIFASQSVFILLLAAGPNIDEILRVLTAPDNINVLREAIHGKNGKSGFLDSNTVFTMLRDEGPNMGKVITTLANQSIITMLNISE